MVLFWFRRGWVLRMGPLLALLVISGCSEATFVDLFATRDQQGRRHFENCRFDLAAEKFEDPMWKGLAFYAAENWEGAVESFALVETPEGYFNLGNAYCQAGKYITAISAYDKSLELRPTYREARSNRELWQASLDGLKESTDAEEAQKGAPEASEEASQNLREDQRAEKSSPPELDEQVEPAEQTNINALTSEMDEAWMRRVTTRPEDFLRAKFAAQGQGGRQ